MKLLLAAGGSGGHLIPALAVADYFMESDKAGEVLIVGTGKALEKEIIGDSPFQSRSVMMSGFVAKNIFDKFLSLIKMSIALCQSLGIILWFKPNAVIGFGGYVTVPILLAAFICRKRIYIHESNAVCGLANRLLSRFANKVYTNHPDAGKYLKSKNIQQVGVPLRKNLWHASQNFDRKPNEGPLNLLVFGGSQGAHHINKIVSKVLAKIDNLQIAHQTGKKDLDIVKAAYAKSGSQVQVLAFISDMSNYYRKADLVICRAGAMTVAELIAFSCPSILVPLSVHRDGQQLKNARRLVDSGAARLIENDHLSEKILANTLNDLLSNPQELLRMGLAAKSLIVENAAETMVREIVHHD